MWDDRANDRDILLTEWIRDQVPSMPVSSVSVPEPVLLAHNLVGVVADPELARDVVRDWERIEPGDGAVGMVVVGRPADHVAEVVSGEGAPPLRAAADPEGVTGHAAKRTVIGAIPGALIGAVVVAGLLILLGASTGLVIGAAIGGAAVGSVAGAVLSVAAGTGWGAAYKESFVDPVMTDFVLTSIHSDSPDRITAAWSAASRRDGVALYRVDRSGRAEPWPTPA